MSMEKDTNQLTFWEHLDVLRDTVIRIVVVAVLAAVVAFLFKDELFDLVLAPKNSDFVTYRLIQRVCMAIGVEGPDDFSVQLINTGLAEQFVIHMKTAMCMGVLCASPYIIYKLFRFVLPALYDNERKYALTLVGSGYVMFMVGVAVSYFLIFPFTFRFLGTYQVSGDVANMVTLQSYMSTMIMMCITLGIVFEMPIIVWIMSKMGLVSASFLRNYRRHAIVAILVVAAVITPTSDVFTLLLVSLPMYLLFEFSILIIK